MKRPTCSGRIGRYDAPKRTAHPCALGSAALFLGCLLHGTRLLWRRTTSAAHAPADQGEETEGQRQDADEDGDDDHATRASAPAGGRGLRMGCAQIPAGGIEGAADDRLAGDGLLADVG